MLHMLALAAAATVEPVVSTAWLQAHLNEPQVRVIYVGDRGEYDRAHIPGARRLDHMETVQMSGDGHRLASRDVLVRAFTKAGAADGAHVVLYGDSPMATGWVYMALDSIGHGGEVSWLDGGTALWQSESRPTSTSTPAPGAGPLTAQPGPDTLVDAVWVRGHLDSPKTKVLDVRTRQEWNNGHLPGATLVLWQDLFADQRLMKFKSPDEIRALLARAGVAPDQEVVTYCAVGMRASLMYWAARAVGQPARVYVGSWQDWSRDSRNPTVK
jgi:thiosulfate/3-mercaptopyruvate sulfurtransferase